MLLRRLTELQLKVSELETETDRLSGALEVQKGTTSQAESAAAKRVEEVSKEFYKKVSDFSGARPRFLLTV